MINDTIENKTIEPNIQEKNEKDKPPQKSESDATQAKIPVTQKTSETVEEDANFKAFREGRKKDRLAREEAERRAAEKETEIAALKAAMEAAFSKTQPSGNSYGQSYQQEESEDERIEKKVQAALAAKEKQFREEALAREQQEAPKRITQMYPDFKQIVTQENCDFIDFHYPELSAPFEHMPEGVEKWSAMYNVIKKFVPNAKTAKKDAARADANLIKPKSISGTGMTQSQTTASSHILSEDRKAANWARMQQTIKGLT